MVGETKISMKLMASLAPARAEIEAGVVAKADQHFPIFCGVLWFLINLRWLALAFLRIPATEEALQARSQFDSCWFCIFASSNSENFGLISELVVSIRNGGSFIPLLFFSESSVRSPVLIMSPEWLLQVPVCLSTPRIPLILSLENLFKLSLFNHSQSFGVLITV